MTPRVNRESPEPASAREPSNHPELSAVILPPEVQMVARFLITKRSPHTRFAYGADLGVRWPRPGQPEPANGAEFARLLLTPIHGVVPAWLAWCHQGRVDPLGLVPEEFAAAWARALESAGLKQTTVARKLAAVSSWYTWMVRNGHAPANPAANLARPEINRDEGSTPGLTKEQALALLAYARTAKTPAAKRNAALAGLLIYTGARIHEVTASDVDDLGIDQGHHVLKITRKGGKQRKIPVAAPAYDLLMTYLDNRDDMQRLPALPGQVNSGRRPLIATGTGARMRDEEGRRIMQRLARGAKLPAELVRLIGAHTGRVVFATLALDDGVPLHIVQDDLDHGDPRTTRGYHRKAKRLENAAGYRIAAILADES